MFYWRLYLSLVLFHAVLFSCSDATNRTEFVTTDRSKLKILAVFGHPGKSHFWVFKPLLEELARRGHEITVLSHFPRSESDKMKEALPTYKDINLFDPKMGIFLEIMDFHNMRHSIFGFPLSLHLLRNMSDVACNSVLRNPIVKEFLRTTEKFDVIIEENFNTDCFLGFVHRFNAPYLTLMSHSLTPWANEVMGNEDNPSYVPVIFNDFDILNMNFFKRILNVIIIILSRLAYKYWYRPLDQVIANELFGPDLPDLEEIAKQSKALLVNTHSSLHSNRALLHNVVEVGGLHIPSKINPLPKDLAQFLDTAPEGVLYFNFGSMLKTTTMPKEKLDIMLNVISEIPRKVIWKWESDEPPRRMDNVLARKWIPQFDVLNHPNVKCFLGHGGLLGLSEGVYAGVPMVLIPMYGDQFHNAAMAKSRGVAKVLEFADLDESSLRHAIDEIFNNTKYLENARKLSKAYRDRPATPLETAVWWTEHIARGNSNSYLRSLSADVPWHQRYLVDVMLVLIIVCSTLIYTVFRVIKLLLSLFCGIGRSQKNKRKVD